ncbi:Arc family DNA-binding protein [Mesorhizobium sp. YM1C-6-2]|uniref:Arc family DNA-binding protein n=1 Tax=Mesorhizobium sp. YM1C-6-2 TaxID=1827501 RepID=UPI000EF17B38|nr:Arc family DNA-binding protein [Mesorhizobium sp. YM1C-6-2]RLP22285.1 Arc family DNA-binding protein [Mesorhizobium sp. YM1C-6-2]
MAREDLHFRLRIPQDLKQRIEAHADLNERSMTAEIVSRLYESVNDDSRARIVSADLDRAKKQIAEQEEELTVLRAARENFAEITRQNQEVIRLKDEMISLQEETKQAMRENIATLQKFLLSIFDALDRAAEGDDHGLNRLVDLHKKSPARDDPFLQEVRRTLAEEPPK